MPKQASQLPQSAITALVSGSLDPTNQRIFKRLIWVLAGLFAVMIISIVIPSPPGSQGIAQYVPLHTFLETVSITISLLIFAVGMATQRVMPSFRVRWIAIMFLGVAVLDFTHMISFAGMPDFITPSGAEKSINFWLAARLFTVLALLGAALIPQDAIWNDRYQIMPLGVIVSLIGFHIWFLFFPNTVPRTFIPGEGLTAFKNGAEYVLMAGNAVAAALFFRSLSRRDRLDSTMLFGAAATAVMSGYFFTLYADVTDSYNLLGHVYKIIAYGFLYRGIFVSMVLAPHDDLQAARNRLTATIDALPDMLFELDEKGVCRRVHCGGFDQGGVQSSHLIGQTLTSIVHNDDQEQLQHALDHVLAGSGTKRVEVRIGQRALELSVSGFKADAANNPTVLVLGRDITERTQREVEINKLTSIIDNSPFPVIITDAQARIEYVNQAFSAVSGYSRDEVQGRNPGFLKSGATPVEVYRNMWASISRGRIWRGEFINRRKDGKTFTELAHIFPISGSDGEIVNYMAYKEDITERKAIAQQLDAATSFDPLTGLPNRTLVERRFLNAIADVKEAGDTTLMIIDVDNFRVLNDALGWGTGDDVLKALAMRLQEAVGPGNTLARAGSDEFVALFPALTSLEAAAMAQKLLNLAHNVLTIDHEEIALTYSIGIARYPEDGITFDAISVSAEAAMRAAKSEGRNRYSFFAAELQEYATRRHDVGNALRTALDLGQFHLVFQPKLSLRTGDCIGAEALLRWTHPSLGVISPAEFIPIAEEQGSIDGIGDWVIRQAFEILSKVNALDLEPVPISINLSAVQFNQADLVGRIQQLVSAHSLTPDLIEFELTEAAALRYPERAKSIIRTLHKAGFTVSLDDFGTGYSSFQYLRNLEVQRLKMDCLFVNEIVSDKKNQAIAEGIIRLAHAIGMVAIAEGVETDEQRKVLTDLGCDEIQGYIYSKPLPLPDFISFLEAR